MYSYDKMNVTIEFYPETYPKTTYVPHGGNANLHCWTK